MMKVGDYARVTGPAEKPADNAPVGRVADVQSHGIIRLRFKPGGETTAYHINWVRKLSDFETLALCLELDL